MMGLYTFIERLISFHDSENKFPGFVFPLVFFGLVSISDHAMDICKIISRLSLSYCIEYKYCSFKNYGRKLFQVPMNYKQQCISY